MRWHGDLFWIDRWCGCRAPTQIERPTGILLLHEDGCLQLGFIDIQLEGLLSLGPNGAGGTNWLVLRGDERTMSQMAGGQQVAAAIRWDSENSGATLWERK